MSRSRLLGSAVLLFVLIGWSSPAAADRRTERIVAALGCDAHVVDVVSADDWTLTKVDLADEAVALRIDILVGKCGDAERTLFMFPGAGLNFEGNFFTPQDRNIAHFMRKRGYLVIGISSRADSLTSLENHPFLAGWGLAKLRDDTHAVITKLKPVIGRHFDILGHSLGGLRALDYAARFPRDPRKLFIIDSLGPYDPVTEPTLVSRSEATFGAYQTLLSQGTTAIDFSYSARQLFPLARRFPDLDSGVPRFPFPGNFTLEGLLHFSLIHTGQLPGIITPLTGLPQNWFIGQNAAGTYTFDPTFDPTLDPAFLDTYSLTHVQLELFDQPFGGSGIVPTAQLRDLTAVMSDNGEYVIPFEDIRARVSWVNAGLGLGNHPYAARLIAAGGNRGVRYSVVDGYGHADPAYGSNAERDYWSVLVGD